MYKHGGLNQNALSPVSISTALCYPTCILHLV